MKSYPETASTRQIRLLGRWTVFRFSAGSTKPVTLTADRPKLPVPSILHVFTCF